MIGTAKTVAKELLPPVVLRLAKSFTNSQIVRDKQIVKDEKGFERTSDYYDRRCLELDNWRIHYSKTEYYPLWSVIVDRIQRANVKSLLEIGCGGGQLATLMRDKGINKYLGFDFSPNFVATAKKACPEFNFVVADAFETDLFYTYDYDAVVSTEFLEHVEGDLEVIKKIRQGTRFYGSVPNFPMKSHVRHFNSVQEVYDRYNQYFDSFRVDTFFSTKDESIVYYLFEAIKR
ncbi:MAG: class I SAM-dependent methyltransferase [Nostoc sp. ChiSLP02]|nr:class I SAM-dependent methyltransferase [Nostoc sp. DedSLP05]MDZ8100325.1 class I SAM-dependent methyltransferase [Nostoc sp. DedSLP01]MDZ8188330.1 class I SAM-dependent methyltransferase [Nostoc sp. ChiSLP02]